MGKVMNTTTRGINLNTRALNITGTVVISYVPSGKGQRGSLGAALKILTDAGFQVEAQGERHLGEVESVDAAEQKCGQSREASHDG